MIAELEQVARRPVSRETFDRIASYVGLLRTENEHQNLISGSTLDRIWERHILDSAQLVRFEPYRGASWLDIGSGAGLPGIVVALLVEGPVTLVEPRKLRAEFLHKATESLDLDATVVCAKAQQVEGSYDVITARAVTGLARLLEISQHLSTGKTVWALPKGRSALGELAETRSAWQGVFHVERSVTDDESMVIVASGVRAKRQ